MIDKLQQEQDQLRSENNSQRKKIISLQIDYEKLSRRPSQIHSESSGQADEPFHLASESPHLPQDVLNCSVQSDVATSQLRPENKLEYDPLVGIQEQNATMDMGDLARPLEEETKSEPVTAEVQTIELIRNPEPEVQFSISSATLALLAEENAQLKDDIDRKMNQIKEYRYLVDEFNDKLQAEVAKSEHMKLMLRTVESTSGWGFGARTEQTKIMNELVK